MTRHLLLLFLLIATNLVACGPNPAQPYAPPAPPTPLPQSMIVFRVTLPAPIEAGESLVLNILDEVTGLAMNVESYTMTAEDASHYSIILPLSIGSVVKYRYGRQGRTLLQEHLSDGRPVRYRLYYVTGPGIVEDQVSRWTDTAFSGPSGRITGRVNEAQSGQPLANILICAGGAQALTASDGSFLLEGLPPATHNLVALALDGGYRTYQQGAIVAASAATPVQLSLSAAPQVTVGFLVILPKDTPTAAVPRLAGNLLQTGNTFGNLTGGLSSIASKMPTLSRLPDGRYNVTLRLPAGADLRYKYTLGDGLWSSEQKATGGFRLRQLIVPEHDFLVEDMVDTWRTGSHAPLTFEVSAPTTPEGETLSIQLNPGFSWTPPIPMWQSPDGRWKFTLTSPLHLVGEIGYRFCRQEQCGRADDARTMGSDSPPLAVIPVSDTPITQTVTVDRWVWLTPPTVASVPSLAATPRGEGFVAGVEFQPGGDPLWQPHWPTAVQSAMNLHSNWVFFTPTWHITRTAPPVIEIVAGQDALWSEMVAAISQANSLNLKVALFPTPVFPLGAADWWQVAPRDFGWWVSWFDQYRLFVLHHADLAARNNAQALVLGGEWLSPMLPGGELADGTFSGVPADAEDRWRMLIHEIRARYGGLLLWALPYPEGVQSPPSFVDEVDGLYVLWSAPLAQTRDASAEDMQIEAGKLLDNTLQPLQERSGKRLILGLSYPSADGGAMGCVLNLAGGCLTIEELSRLREDIASAPLDFQEQTSAYIAMFSAIETRPWISGVVSRGFYPPLPLQDQSASVHGKPAAGVLWFWFPQWQATANQP